MDSCSSLSEPVSETPRQAARRARIVDIARAEFLTEGYAATSMSAIAAKLGGSKGTLYNYYASKEELFAAVMQAHCERAAARFNALDSASGDLRERLQRFGFAYLEVMLSDDFLDVYRLVTGESGRFPEIGVAFYEAAAKRGKRWMSDIVALEMEKGALRRDDPEKVARQFLGLCRSDVHNRLLWRVIERPTAAEMSRLVSEAADVILAAYAP